MPFWTLRRIAAALAGADPATPTPAREARTSAHDERAIANISTDTRAVAPGDAFLALEGDRFNGHDFLGEAVEAGAIALIVSKPERVAGLGVPVFTVGDTLHALGQLARYRRRAWGQPVIAVGGSNGKTSTKELLRAALGARLSVHATTGNLNNQIGVPRTLLDIPDDADIAVVEMGTSLPGEMALLRAIAAPDIAVITSIGEEHLEGLGSLAGVLAEEAALAEGVPLVIVPATEAALIDAVRRCAGRVSSAALDRETATGADSEASTGLTSDAHGLNPDGTGWLKVGGIDVHVPLLGEHNLRNAMLALAAAQACGIALADAAAGIARMTPPSMRSNARTIGRALLINDAYNSNPPSARAALDLLATMGAGRPMVAVIGTMRELGASAPELHREIAARALAGPATLIAGVGDMGDALRSLAPSDIRVVTAADPDALWPLLEPRLAPDSCILLKASRGVRLERIVPLLEGWAARG